MRVIPSAIQKIKDLLVSLGPGNRIVRLALKYHARKQGFAISFPGATIAIRRGSYEMILPVKDFYLVPFTLECFEQVFQEIDSKPRGELQVLDFSVPGAHRYKRHNVTLQFPGTPEDDSIAAYTHWYQPQPGDLVFDIGAHAGFTTCLLSRMVSPGGRVVAFEPDPASILYLQRNVCEQHISNVTIVPEAMDASTGTAYFNADGTMGAGLVKHSVYADTGRHIAVPTTSFEDACRKFGVPQFVKMDIEGAEIEVIHSAAEFLKAHSIHLAFDSYHRMPDGGFAWMLLEPMLNSFGYAVESSADFGQMFTWGKKHSGAQSNIPSNNAELR